LSVHANLPIDVEVVNDPDPAANTAVPAEFAGFFVVEGFIGYLGLNKCLWHSEFRAASHAAWIAHSNSAIGMPNTALTARSSTNVYPF
jgi:hypothetical protein